MKTQASKTLGFAYNAAVGLIRRNAALVLGLALFVTGVAVSAEADDHRSIIVTFDAPNVGTAPGLGTLAVSINPEGAIAGYYLKANVGTVGFLRS